MPRHCALDRDLAFTATARLRTPRVKRLHFTPFFCDRRRCFPVRGAALVYKAVTHLTVAFATTLAPYLRRALDAALAG